MSAKGPLLSVILPTCNRPAALLRAVRALLDEVRAHELGVEIVVVDDASDAAAAREIEAELARTATSSVQLVQLVQLARRRGAAGARNAGVERSQGSVIAFLDDDIVPADDYLRQTIAFHERHPDVLVVNGNLRPLHDDTYSRFWFHLYDATFNRPGGFYPVPMLASGHCSIKRQILELESPLFDAALLQREDLDLYLRLERRGVPVYKCDAILAHNDCRRTLSAFVQQYAAYEVSEQQLLVKHGRAAVDASRAQRPIRREWRFAHLYVLLRLARETALLRGRLRRLRSPAPAQGHPV